MIVTPKLEGAKFEALKEQVKSINNSTEATVKWVKE